MPCGWEGNRRSGVALVMRRRLQWFIRAYGLRKGDEHPAYTPRGVWHSFTCIIYAEPLIRLQLMAHYNDAAMLFLDYGESAPDARA